MWNFILVFILLIGGQGAQDILHHACPDKHIVSQINSPTDRDQQWGIECKAFRATSRCSWFGARDEKLNCPDNHVVAGVYSNNKSTHGRRSAKLLCCSAPNFTTFECRKTPVVSYFSEDFHWQLPAGHFLTGVQTHQKNIHGDHRWSFSYCKGRSKVPQLGEDHFMKGGIPFVRNKRNARICQLCRWPKRDKMVQVPYTIDNAFTSEEKEELHFAMSEFHMDTCIRFVAHKEQMSYIRIVKTKKACESQIGRTGSDQVLSLGEGCVQIGIIQHELLHVLGFWHEQNRFDRDDYVLVNFDNIKENQKKNFRKLNTNNLGVPYDYSSVMHYARKTFTKNGKDTIKPLDPSASIGQRDGMSTIDILKINKLYNCTQYLHKYGTQNNKLKSAFSSTCPSGQAVSGITSQYIRDQKARLWSFSCQDLNVITTCRWSASVNHFRKDFKFNCGINKVIAGAYSYYSNSFQDRKWKFYCCSDPGITMLSCRTKELNDYHKSFSWTAHSGYYLTGVESSYDEETHDRLWSLTSCRMDTQ